MLDTDLIDSIPPPETVKAMLQDSVRRSELLRSLLRLARRKAAYTHPTTAAGKIADYPLGRFPMTTTAIGLPSGYSETDLGGQNDG